MFAILSDIHGNLEALEAVLKDARTRGIANFYCLGDTVGLGPDAARCVEHVQSFDLCLSGNWDYLLTGNGETKSRRSKIELQFWTDSVRAALTPEQLDFLKTRPSVQVIDGKTYAHGDPIDTVNGYLFPETIYEADQMELIFSAFDGFFHCGHTHIGGVFTQKTFEESNQFEGKFRPDSKSAIINVGSVGKPRDGDPRACYVVDYGTSYEFIRVPYDYEATRRKLEDLDPPRLSE